MEGSFEVLGIERMEGSGTCVSLLGGLGLCELRSVESGDCVFTVVDGKWGGGGGWAGLR